VRPADAGTEEGEMGRGSDEGLSTGVDVCTAAVGNGIGGAVSILDHKPSTS